MLEGLYDLTLLRGGSEPSLEEGQSLKAALSLCVRERETVRVCVCATGRETEPLTAERERALGKRW